MFWLLINASCALRSLIEQKTRALLSTIGVMVGSFAIVLLVSIAEGVQKDIENQVNDLGINLLVVLPGRVGDSTMFNPNFAGLSYLQFEDVQTLSQVPGIKRATPLTFVGGGIRSDNKESPSTMIIAAGPGWFQTRPVELAEGKLYDQSNETERVCVIGSIARKQLFGENSAIGKKVLINGTPYEVIGVTKDKQSEESLFSMGTFENVAYIPFAQFQKQEGGTMLHRIMLQTQPDAEPKELIRRIDNTLAKRLDRQMFSVVTQQDLLRLIYRVMRILTYLLVGLTGIALFVGGVGIMAIMLMSVSERTKEIGIRKTVGAKQADIFQQFLFEALLISFLGGCLGLGLSYVADLIIVSLTPIKPITTLQTIALAIGVSVGVGAFFGLLPALSAARKDPVISLRSE